MHIGGVCSHFVPSLTHNENVPLKHPIPVNTSLYSSFILHVFALTAMQLPYPDP